MRNAISTPDYLDVLDLAAIDKHLPFEGIAFTVEDIWTGQHHRGGYCAEAWIRFPPEAALTGWDENPLRLSFYLPDHTLPQKQALREDLPATLTELVIKAVKYNISQLQFIAGRIKKNESMGKQ